MTRWLVTGARGMLGRDVMAGLRPRRETVLGLGRTELDVTDEAAVKALVTDYRPGFVINCAAWTAVDAAQEREGAALRVNGLAPGYLAAACARAGARLVHVSAVQVFSGASDRPYREDDRPAPVSGYGRTKLAGERAVLGLLPRDGLVVRTAWLYGGAGPSFVHTMITLAGTGQDVDVADDQRGQPTWTADVAGRLIALADSAAPPGIYHVTSSGETTWAGLAREVFGLVGTDQARVRPVPGGAFGRVPRPACALLAHDRHAVGGIEPIGDWRLALRRAWPVLVTAPAAGSRAASPAAGSPAASPAAGSRAASPASSPAPSPAASLAGSQAPRPPLRSRD